MRPLGANPSLTAPQAGPVATQPCQSCQAPTAVPTSAGTGTPVRIQSTAGGAELVWHQVPDDAFRHHRAETSPRCDQISKGCSPGRTTEALITGHPGPFHPSLRPICNAAGPEPAQQPRRLQQVLTVLQFSTPSTGPLRTCIRRGRFYSSS